jgi:hypothetical protein
VKLQLTSSAFRSFQSPCLRSVPVDPVVRESRGDKGVEDRLAPVVAQDLDKVLSPAQVVRGALGVVLVRRLAVED